MKKKLTAKLLLLLLVTFLLLWGGNALAADYTVENHPYSDDQHYMISITWIDEDVHKCNCCNKYYYHTWNYTYSEGHFCYGCDNSSKYHVVPHTFTSGSSTCSDPKCDYTCDHSLASQVISSADGKTGSCPCGQSSHTHVWKDDTNMRCKTCGHEHKFSSATGKCYTCGGGHVCNIKSLDIDGDCPKCHQHHHNHSWYFGVCNYSGCGYQCPHTTFDTFPSGNQCHVCKAMCIHEYEYGVTAWIADTGTCRSCGTAHDHTKSWDSENDKCTVCGFTCTNHVWGTDADGNYDGVCDDCGFICRHEDSTTTDKCSTCSKSLCNHIWQQDKDEPAKHKCTNCSISQTHSYDTKTGDGKCRVCGLTCTHIWNPSTGKCDTCGFTCTHTIPDDYDCNAASYTCATCGREGLPAGHRWKHSVSDTQNAYTPNECTQCDAECKHYEVTDADAANCAVCGVKLCWHHVWKLDSGKHVCANCGEFTSNGGADHPWNSDTGICSAEGCGAVCEHQYLTNFAGACYICKKQHTDHNWNSATGQCTICYRLHSHILDWENGKCKVCGYVCTHTLSGEGRHTHLSDTDADYLTSHICYDCKQKVKHDWKRVSGTKQKHECDGCGIIVMQCVPDENGMCMADNCYECSHLKYIYDAATQEHKCKGCDENYGPQHILDDNGKCKAEGCTYQCPHNGGFDTLDEVNHICKICRAELPHSMLYDGNTGVHLCNDSCGYTTTDHTLENGRCQVAGCNYCEHVSYHYDTKLNTHVCDYCSLQKEQHVFGSDGKCTISGCEAVCQHADVVYNKNGKYHYCKDCNKYLGEGHVWDPATGLCRANGAGDLNCDGKCTPHTWDTDGGVATGKCSTCGYTCKHPADASNWNLTDTTTGTCKTCGKTHTHGSWQQITGNATQHACGVEDNCPYKADHSWQSDGATGHKCSACSATANHDWSAKNGICATSGCGYTCQHSADADDWTLTDTTGTCTICQKTHTHGSWQQIPNNVKQHVCGADTDCPFTAEHSWQPDENDSTKHKCSDCSFTAEHSWQQDENDPTKHKCSDCSAMESHVWQQIDGNITRHKCGSCLTMADHNWKPFNDEGSHKCDDCDMTDSHTCTTDGADTHTCSTCKEHFSHDWRLTDDSTAEVHNCARCTQTAPHDWDENGKCERGLCGYQCLHDTKGWTQTETTGTCKNCGASHTHDLKDGVCQTCLYVACDHTAPRIDLRWKLEPGCETDGIRIQECSKCHKEIEQPVRAYGHLTVIDSAVAPSCAAPGLTEGRHCGVCGLTMIYQRVVPALDHTPVIDPAVEASCNKTGLTEGSHCSVCGEVIEEQQVVSKLDHSVVIDPAVEASCTNTGLTEGSHCSVCGEVIEEQQVVSKLDHSVAIDPAVEASCTKTGLTEGSHCSVCGEVIQEQQVVSKLDHSVVIDPAVEASCNKTGRTEGSHCSVCGEIIEKQEIIPARKHNLVGSFDEKTLTISFHCTICGHIRQASFAPIFN